MASNCCHSLWHIVRSITVEPVLFLYMFSSSLTFSAFMSLAYDKSCLNLYNNTTLCEKLNNATFAKMHQDMEDEVQNQASHWIMMNNVAITVPATVVLVVWLGGWGDRVGRRLPVMIPCIFAILYSVSNLINAVYMDWHPALLLIGPVFSGLGGSYIAAMMACYTYLTHAAEPKSRMMRVGFAEAANFLASTISVFVSGRMVDTVGYVPVFCNTLICQILALLYTITILPDVKPSEVKQRQGCHQTCGAPAQDMWTFVTFPRQSFNKLHLVLLILVLDILQLCTTGENDILLLYLKRSPRNWSYTMYGFFKGAENFTRGIALFLLPLLKYFFHLPDTFLILAGLISKLAGLIVLGLATSQTLIFFVVLIAVLQGYPSAGLRSLMATLVSTNEQGRLFGLVAATECIITFVSTVIFNGLYPVTLDTYDGLCFQLAAGLVFLSFWVVLWQHFAFKKYEYVSVRTSLSSSSDRNLRGPPTPSTSQEDVSSLDVQTPN